MLYSLAQYRADHANQITYDNWRNLRGGVGMYSQWDDHEVRNDWDSQTVDPQLLKKMYVLRRILNPMGTVDAIEFLLDKMKDTKTNADFFDAMKR